MYIKGSSQCLARRRAPQVETAAAPILAFALVSWPLCRHHSYGTEAPYGGGLNRDPLSIMNTPLIRLLSEWSSPLGKVWPFVACPPPLPGNEMLVPWGWTVPGPDCPTPALLGPGVFPGGINYHRPVGRPYLRVPGTNLRSVASRSPTPPTSWTRITNC